MIEAHVQNKTNPLPKPQKPVKPRLEAHHQKPLPLKLVDDTCCILLYKLCLSELWQEQVIREAAHHRACFSNGEDLGQREIQDFAIDQAFWRTEICRLDLNRSDF